MAGIAPGSAGFNSRTSCHLIAGRRRRAAQMTDLQRQPGPPRSSSAELSARTPAAQAQRRILGRVADPGAGRQRAQILERDADAQRVQEPLLRNRIIDPARTTRSNGLLPRRQSRHDRPPQSTPQAHRRTRAFRRKLVRPNTALSLPAPTRRVSLPSRTVGATSGYFWIPAIRHADKIIESTFTDERQAQSSVVRAKRPPFRPRIYRLMYPQAQPSRANNMRRRNGCISQGVRDLRRPRRSASRPARRWIPHTPGGRRTGQLSFDGKRPASAA